VNPADALLNVVHEFAIPHQRDGLFRKTAENSTAHGFTKNRTGAGELRFSTNPQRSSQQQAGAFSILEKNLVLLVGSRDSS
jgi:hypothetical protein